MGSVLALRVRDTWNKWAGTTGSDTGMMLPYDCIIALKRMYAISIMNRPEQTVRSLLRHPEGLNMAYFNSHVSDFENLHCLTIDKQSALLAGILNHGIRPINAINCEISKFRQLDRLAQRDLIMAAVDKLWMVHHLFVLELLLVVGEHMLNKTLIVGVDIYAPYATRPVSTQSVKDMLDQLNDMVMLNLNWLIYAFLMYGPFTKAVITEYCETVMNKRTNMHAFDRDYFGNHVRVSLRRPVEFSITPELLSVVSHECGMCSLSPSLNIDYP